MKKCFKLLSAALIALASFVPAQALELTVFDGTDLCGEVPMRPYWFDQETYKVQTILPASEFESIVGASITSMKFYVAGANGNLMNGGKVLVSIGKTAMDAFPSYSPAFSTEELTQVAEITMTPGDPEIVIDFDEPWVYEGGNIMIQTYVEEAGNDPTMNFLGVATGVQNAGYGKSYPTTTGFYPKTTFAYTGGVEDMAKVSTTALDFGQIYPEQVATETFTLKNLGQNAFTPVFSGLQAPFSIAPAPAEIAAGKTVEYTVTFAPNAIGEYNQTLAIDCGAAGQFEIALTGAMVERPAEVVVAEGTATSSTLPVEVGAYNYSAAGNQAQMIYNGNLLTDLVGKKINGIKFHASAPLQSFNGGQIQLSLKVVEQSAYESNTPITDLTVVATGAPVIGESELVFTFDEPFTYEGGNLVVETLTTQAGDYSFRDKFLGVATTDYVSYGHFNDLGWETHVYKFLPMATFSYVKEDTPQPEVLRGDVNKDTEVNIADVTALIDMLLNDAEMIPEADCNKDTEMNIADVTALIDFLLNGQW